MKSMLVFCTCFFVTFFSPCCISEAPTPAPIAIPIPSQRPILFVKVLIKVPNPVPRAIPIACFFYFSFLGLNLK